MNNPRVPFQMSSERPALKPPKKGKKLIVHNVVNVEYWPFDQPMPRKMLSTPHGMETIPDIPNYSWAEYGLRCGMPRLLDLFASMKLPVSVNLNSTVIERYPSVAKAMLDAGWEFIGHGYTQRLLHKEPDEEATIQRALDQVSAFTGKKVRGWMGPGFAQTFDTPDILKKLGIEYNLDWVLDDLPCWMKTKHGPLICMPYGFELNDSLVYTVERQSSPEIRQRLRDTLRTFDPELKKQPRVLTLGLHPHQIGVPHRMPYLVKCLKSLRRRDDVIFMTGSQIADWYLSADPAPANL
jgi:peptidoglycan/xylan/chitin deacetylase (PgdA/CDA1 family)